MLGESSTDSASQCDLTVKQTICVVVSQGLYMLGILRRVPVCFMTGEKLLKGDDFETK